MAKKSLVGETPTLFDLYGGLVEKLGPRIDRVTTGKLDLNKQFFMVAGVDVVPKPPVQKTFDANRQLIQPASLERMFEDGEECEDYFHSMLADITRKADAVSFLKPLSKTWASAQRKRHEDYKGDFARVCDIKRSTIYVNAPEQIRKIVNILRPDNNSATIRLEDGFSYSDRDGGLRRILANVRMPNGHAIEIQVRHIGMEKAYEKTAKIWPKIRAMRAMLDPEGDCKVSRADVAPLTKQLSHLETQRTKIHTTASKANKVDDLVIERTFNLVGGFPVMSLYDPWNKEYSAIVPDARTGKFVTDNRFLSSLASEDEGVQHNITREQFLIRSAAIATSPEAKAYLELIA